MNEQTLSEFNLKVVEKYNNKIFRPINFFPEIKLMYSPNIIDGRRLGFEFYTVERTAEICIEGDVRNELWIEQDYVRLVCFGSAAFDGIRHLYFSEHFNKIDGYIYCPNMNLLQSLFKSLSKLQRIYCPSLC